MLLVKTSNGQVEQFPYTLGDLRRDNPQTSFPKKIGDAILASYSIFHVMPDARPECDHMVQRVVQDVEPHREVRTRQPDDEQPTDVSVGDTYETGRWVIGHSVVNNPQEQAETSIRNHRDELLQATDWQALSDNVMSGAVTTYRQALRDVPYQDDFPFGVVWPDKP
jgi:hypothetical protein